MSLVGGLIGGGIGGIIGGYFGAKRGSSSGGGGGGGYGIDNYDAMKKEMAALRRHRENIKRFNAASEERQKQILANTEEIKKLLEYSELAVRLALMTDEEKIIFRNFMAVEEQLEYERQCEARVEEAIRSRRDLRHFAGDRYENHDYMEAIFDAMFCVYARDWYFRNYGSILCELMDDEQFANDKYLLAYKKIKQELSNLITETSTGFHIEREEVARDAQMIYAFLMNHRSPIIGTHFSEFREKY